MLKMHDLNTVAHAKTRHIHTIFFKTVLINSLLMGFDFILG